MIKNYNLNVTEVRDSDFKNDFPGIFNFTVGILPMKFDQKVHQKALLELFDIGAQTKPSHLFVNSINLKTESSLSHHFIESHVYESYL